MLPALSFLTFAIVALASNDFTAETIGLGTSQAVEFDFNNKNIWKVYTRSLESQVVVSANETYLYVAEDQKPAIVTSGFSIMYGKADFMVKAAQGKAVTSCKISGAYSGVGMSVSGESPTKFTATYNGTYGEPDIINTGIDLTAYTNTWSIRYTPDVIMWYVNGKLLHEKYRSNFTNPVDIANWPTSPDTINVMLEQGEKDNVTNTATLSNIVVQDYTGGKYYEPMNPGVLVQSDGKTKYPSSLSLYVKKAVKRTAVIKRDLESIEDYSGVITKRSNGTNGNSSTPEVNYENKASGRVFSLTILGAVALGLLAVF